MIAAFAGVMDNHLDTLPYHHIRYKVSLKGHYSPRLPSTDDTVVYSLVVYFVVTTRTGSSRVAQTHPLRWCLTIRAARHGPTKLGIEPSTQPYTPIGREHPSQPITY
jgi:hypothetical protein